MLTDLKVISLVMLLLLCNIFLNILFIHIANRYNKVTSRPKMLPPITLPYMWKLIL